MNLLTEKLGIVAGGGVLPSRLAEFCERNRIGVFIAAFEGHADPALLVGRDHMLTRLGAAGQIIGAMRERGIHDLVLIGSVKRPKLSEMRPDLRTAKFFARLGLRALGDDGLLKAVRRELEDEGFVIHGIQDIVPDLFMPKGLLSQKNLTDEQWETVRIGLASSRKLGRADVGQSVVALDEDVIDLEDDTGTNALIRRAARPGAILVKSAKPQQDRKLDMPTIGPQTIELCASLRYAGIAAEADGVLLADRETMVRMADEAGLFLIGV